MPLSSSDLPPPLHLVQVVLRWVPGAAVSSLSFPTPCPGSRSTVHQLQKWVSAPGRWGTVPGRHKAMPSFHVCSLPTGFERFLVRFRLCVSVPGK